MRNLFFSLTLSFFFFSLGNAQNEILFFQTNWGYNGGIEDFIKKAKKSGYDGVEIWLPTDSKKQNIISKALKKFNMKVIFLCGTNGSVPFKESLEDYKNYLKNAISQKPLAINSHTGSDFLTFKQNMAFIDVANNLSKAHNIPIYHETHRGRFSYSLPETIKYLKKNKNLILTLDISHWMVVHESLLNDQEKLVNMVINRSNHIHARVGFEEGPQVNDPKAPEWKLTVNRHMEIWESIIKKTWDEDKTITVTTEFGPPNYMPTEPITMKPLSDQWQVNTFIMKSLKDRLKKINLN